MENTNCEDQVPKWFYRSDDYPMKLKSDKITWMEYADSEIIENAYSDYLNCFQDKSLDINDYKIYEITDSDYNIDFDLNIQYLREDRYKSRLIGRFFGDPNISQNTLQEKDISIRQLERASFQLVLSKETNIKSSLMLDKENKDAFIDYLFLDIIFQITEKTKDDQAINDLYMFCFYYINSYEKEKTRQIEELEIFINDARKGKLNNNSLIWNSKESFVFRMVNTVLRKQNHLEIFWIRYYINTLRKALQNLSKYNQTQVLYRGSIMSKKELEIMKNKIGNPFLMNGFISTSGDINVAKGFMKNPNPEEFEIILFVFEADQKDCHKFAMIRNISKFPHEDEYLLNMNNFFKAVSIQLITSETNNYYTITLKFSSEDEMKEVVDPITISYQQFLNEKLKADHCLDSFYLAEIFFILKDGDGIIKLFQNYQFNDDLESAKIFNYIGLAYDDKGLYDKAIEYYEKSVLIKLKTLGENHPSTATSYNNIG